MGVDPDELPLGCGKTAPVGCRVSSLPQEGSWGSPCKTIGASKVPYDSIVCVKQVPDTKNVTAEAMKEDGTVNRAALPTIFNPEDLHALETALEVKDRFGGTVTVLSMGPPKAADVLRDCLFRGADRAILLTDRRAAASDTLATSYILSQAVRTIGRYDLVFCGRQAIDGDTAQVGPQCAEKLGIPQITYLEELISIEGGVARIRRNIGHGWEVVDARLPLLVTVMQTANTPRPQSAKRVMRHKNAKVDAEVAADVQKEQPAATDQQRQEATQQRMAALKQAGRLIEQWNLDDIGADLQRCGLAGSPTKVFRIQSIVLTKEGFTEIAATEEGVRGLIRELVIDRTLG
jgi:electron transfer flavoprotein beta subunit